MIRYQLLPRWMVLAAAFGLAGKVIAEDMTLDPALHPVTRRTLRATYEPPPEGPLRIAFFDADGTLRVSKSGSVSASHPRDVLLLPMVAPALKKLSEERVVIAIVSNQGGVPEFVSLRDASNALRYTIHLLNQEGVPVDYFDLAEGKNAFRKPRTGMGELAARILSMTTGRPIDWENSFMVGDSAWKKGKDETPEGTPGHDFSNSDRYFAINLARDHPGFDFIDPAEFFGWRKYGVARFHKAAEVEAFMTR